MRDFNRISLTIGERLRNLASVPVTQIYDGSLLDNAPVDLTFTVRDDTWKYQDDKLRYQRYNKYVGWAADCFLFYPEKKKHDQLRIFIDHAAFDVSCYDHSLTSETGNIYAAEYKWDSRHAPQNSDARPLKTL